VKTARNCLVLTLLPLLLLALSATRAGARDWNEFPPVNGPGARSGASAATLSDGRVILFGGEDSNGILLDDLYITNGITWNALQPQNDPPAPRRDHDAWVYNDKMYVWGGLGENGQVYDDLWVYDVATNTWEQIAAGNLRPSPRYGHSTTPLPDGSALLFGGTDRDGSPLADLWLLKPDGSYAQLLSSQFPYYAPTAQLSGNYLYVFGIPGLVSRYDMVNGIWEYLERDVPGYRYSTSAFGQNGNGEGITYLFGGLKEDGTESDGVFEYNLDTGAVTERPERMPLPLAHHASAVIRNKQGGNLSLLPAFSVSVTSAQVNEVRVLLFGGTSGGVPVSTTLRFTVSAYGVQLTGPTIRFGQPGEALTHTVSLFNGGLANDTYDLQLGPTVWAASLPFTRTGVLSASQKMTVPVRVTIPADATLGAGNAVTLTVTSVHSPTVTSQMTLRVAVPYRCYLPLGRK